MDISTSTKSLETNAKKKQTFYFPALAITPVTENENVRFDGCRLSYHVILYVVFLAASAYRHDPSCFILTSYLSNVWWCPGRSSVSSTSELSARKRDWISSAVLLPSVFFRLLLLLCQIIPACVVSFCSHDQVEKR